MPVVASACHAPDPGQAAAQHLSANAAVSNRLTEKVQVWVVGPRGRLIQQAIQQHKGLARCKQALAGERAEIAAVSQAVLGPPAPADAGDLQRKRGHYVDDIDTLFVTLARIAALPDDFQSAEFAPPGQTLQQLASDLDKRSQAQDAYASKHPIALRKH